MKHPLSALTRRRRSVTRMIMAFAAAAGIVVLAAGPASAAPVRLDYPLTGTTYLNGTDSNLDLGPGLLETTADLSAGTITANTNLPPATGSFKTLDLIPAEATTEFVESEPTKGTIDPRTGAVNVTSKITLRITSLKILGIPQLIGPWCKTEVPATIPLASEEGFNVFLGGNLSGTYTIPKFKHCLLLTPIINAIIPGPDNRITLTLGPAQVPPAE